MGSTSVRIPEGLLDRLHQAKVSSVSMAQVIETALELAGGPEAVRATLAATMLRDRARAQAARLRRLDHASVVLEPSEQVALASAITAWVDLLREEGHRTFDPGERRLHLSGPATGSDSRATARGGPGMTFERASGEVLG